MRSPALPVLLALLALAGCRGRDPARWTHPLGLTFARIPAGTFLQGSGSAGPLERPSHPVRITRPFYLGVTEVTEDQWAAVMGPRAARPRGDRPVVGVSWEDAQAFIARLNAREGTRAYRLPTEAEWEYACRAGTPGPWYGEPADIAWFEAKAEAEGHAHAAAPGGGARPVGLKAANAWGLHDMLGNVYEWCADWAGPYPSGPVDDPRGPAAGEARVARGGSWLVHLNRTRADFRDFFPLGERRDDLGFRVARDVP